MLRTDEYSGMALPDKLTVTHKDYDQFARKSRVPGSAVGKKTDHRLKQNESEKIRAETDPIPPKNVPEIIQAGKNGRLKKNVSNKIQHETEHMQNVSERIGPETEPKENVSDGTRAESPYESKAVQKLIITNNMPQRSCNTLSPESKVRLIVFET